MLIENEYYLEYGDFGWQTLKNDLKSSSKN
jgi:hypothetical protein